MRTSYIHLLSTLSVFAAAFVVNSKIINPEAPSPAVYPEHLPGAFTGGFGEKTCHSCHFDYDLNMEDGKLTISGIPESIKAEKIYSLKILLQRKDLQKGGFQLSARFANGKQAGIFEITDPERIGFTRQVSDSLQYIQHTSEGTYPESSTEIQWQINWKSPEIISDSIFFNVAANAANGDESEFGDWIYVKEIKTGRE